MTSKSTEHMAEDPNEAVPTSVIAQAEAAIAGTYENGRPPLSKRESKRKVPQSSTGNTGVGSSANPNLLQVPEADGTAPPTYGESHDEIELSQDGFDTKAKVTDDGRINININQKTRKLSDLLVPALRQQLSLVAQEDEAHPLPPGYIPPALGGLPGQTPPPRLNVVIHVVGSRGDVQPFVALGKTLKNTYGHRVRLATHPTFKGFVEENGLEFFSIGGDPSELMAFMVKNPGLMPGIESLKSGDVGKRRKGMEEIVLGCWRSCIEAGDGLGAPTRKDSSDSLGGFDAGINMDTNPADRPFIADCIIANPPSFAHIHIAEKMGIPLHMMFTMPWSPTQQFPHPLANIQSSNADVNMTNFVSYALVEMMTWQGLGDVINRFRERALGLDPISLIWAPGMLSRLRVPYTYCWSPALIPKPKDWGQHISISGFYFLSLASSFTPEAALAAYLADGPPPVYIGFGSIVVDDPNGMTKMIFEAVKKAGVRALVSKGWGGLGADDLGKPDGVFMLGNVPHDWLFQHVSAVVHHGGAGTTAAGIATGKPTVVVPFFGDQPFWGAMVARAGAGPVPIPYKQLTADKLAAAITEALKPETLERAKELGSKIKEEQGTEQGGKSFHDHLHVDSLRCSLAPSRVAVWRLKRTKTRLSALAAYVLAQAKLIDFADLKLYHPREYETDDGPWDPISGGASALIGTIASLGMGVADFPIEIFRAVKKDFSPADAGENVEKNSREKKNKGKETLSPAQTPSASASTSRSQSTLDLGLNQTTSEPTSYLASTTSKSSYEAARSSSETPGFETPLSPATSLGEHRSNSLKQALRGTLNRARSISRDRGPLSRPLSRSNSGDRTPNGRSSSPFRRNTEPKEPFDPSKLTLENANRAGKGISRIVGAGMKSPMDFALGIARGFHNAPKLYGDDTVRPQEKITDFQSGLKAAGKEFGYGMFDGITGLVTQPLRGAEKEGAVGLVKGFAKGIGGLILKPGAAIWGLPGYTLMGINKEVRKMFGSSVLNYIIATRTAQGYEDAQNSSKEEVADIIARWHQNKAQFQSESMKINEAGGPEGQSSGHLTPKGFLQTRNMSSDQRKKLHEERKARREEEQRKLAATPGHKHCPFCGNGKRHVHEAGTVEANMASASNTSMLTRSDTELNEEFEHAIHASVAATSRGNPDEDIMIERAIRASIRELHASGSSTLTDKEALSKAIQASIAASGHQSSSVPHEAPGMSDADLEHQALLEKAIQASLAEYQLPVDHDVDSGDDENIKLAIHKSKTEPTGPLPTDDEDIRLAIQKSQTEHHDDDKMLEEALKKSKEEHEKGMTEEETVLEYVKKQSLLEAQHKSAMDGKKKELAAPEPVSAADEEALRKAIEESMKGSAPEMGGEPSGFSAPK